MGSDEASRAPGVSVVAKADAAQSSVTHHLHYERRWMALGIVVIGQIMILLDATVVNVALPSAQADLTLFLANAAVFAVFLFLTCCFQGVLGCSPITTRVAFLPLMVAVGVVATLTQGVLLQRLTMRVVAAAGLITSGAGAASLAQAGADSPYAAWVLTGLILIGTGIGSAAVVAVAVGQLGIEPGAGTAGALNNVSQQLGSAPSIALISTFVATATHHYLAHHGSTAVVGATVHGFTVGFWWAVGLFWAAAVVCGALTRGGTSLHHEAGRPEPLDDIVSALI